MVNWVLRQDLDNVWYKKQMPYICNMSDEVLKRIEKVKQESGNKRLDLSYCELTSIPEEIIDLDHVISLQLTGNRISEISILKELKGLRSLYLSKNRIRDISSLKELKHLDTLYLFDNKISNLTDLAVLGNLQHLDLSNNNLSDITPLRELVYLESLHLSENNISDISSLKELIYLETLSLGNNLISDGGFLSNLKNLKSLSLNNNNLSDTSFLKELKFLKYLSLGSNGLSDVSYLGQLDYLKSLNLGNNNLTDITALSSLKQLQSALLSKNNISDIMPLLPIIKNGIAIKLKYEDSNIGIFLEDNPLEFPPLEIVKQGNQAILNYFNEKGINVGSVEKQSLAKGDSTRVANQKVTFVDELTKKKERLDKLEASGLMDVKEELLNKLIYLRTSRARLTEGSEKFNLTQDIKTIEKEITAIKQQLKELGID